MISPLRQMRFIAITLFVSTFIRCNGFLTTQSAVLSSHMIRSFEKIESSTARYMSTISNSTTTTKTTIPITLGSPSTLIKVLKSIKPRPCPRTHSKTSTSSTEPMPWRSSIQGEEHDLTFMPYYSHTISTMHDRLSNLRQLSFPPEYEYKENHTKDKKNNNNSLQKSISKSTARIINECYQSDEYRKIRMTYYDAGETQVFNSLWYPRTELGPDLPLLGIDLIQFKNRYLVVVDFQPLQEDTQSIPEIQDVWEGMPEVLRGRMSDRFYDEERFFSKHMLFGRFGKEETLDGLIDVDGGLWDAFEKYLSLHIDMVQDYVERKEYADHTPIDAVSSLTLERHQEYDTYSAARDPAHALFVRIFGKQFADGFVYDFLFSLSDPKVEDTN